MDSFLLPASSMLVFDRLPSPIPHYNPHGHGQQHLYTLASGAGSSLSREPSIGGSSIGGRSTGTGESIQYHIEENENDTTPAPRAESKSKTYSFFSNSNSFTRPKPPSRANTVPSPIPTPTQLPSESDGSGLKPGEQVKGHQKSRSANDSFFFSAPSVRPTPPPSIRSGASNNGNDSDREFEDRKSSLPPLSRFFPSRRRRSSSSSLSSGDVPPTTAPVHNANGHRGFVDIETNEPERPEFEAGPSRLHLQPPSSPTVNIVSSPTTFTSDSPIPNSIIGSSTDTPLTLIKPIGVGSFSSVWLALDNTGLLTSRRGEGRLKSASNAKRRRDWRVHGLRPGPQGKKEKETEKQRELERLKELEEGEVNVARQRSVVLRPSSPRPEEDEEDGDGLVAVKMMARALCDADDRMRISFVREVEVLRHISHPSLIAYLHSFTTPTHHCLVLENITGGELFELLSLDASYARLTASITRRIWSELVKAVGWMHSVGLVHRDIKLENILLTSNVLSPFSNSDASLPPASQPLVKLTDFNLSRFIDPSSPILTTKCGSEAYAAPEIIMSAGKDGYDGRQTDAWACGVVLYGIACRRLPFDVDSETLRSGKRGANGQIMGRKEKERERREYLTRIASVSYTFPPASQLPEPSASILTAGLKSVISRLLVRDPVRRATLEEVWDEGWMDARLEGGLRRPAYRTEGELVDREHIDGVARREVG